MFATLRHTRGARSSVMSPLKYKSRGRCNKKSCVALPRKVEPPLINIRVIILSLASQRRWNVCLTIHVGTSAGLPIIIITPFAMFVCKNCGKERRNGRRLNRSRYNWPGLMAREESWPLVRCIFGRRIFSRPVLSISRTRR